ncbi:MAG TPA: hypothetical protein VFE65_21995 [Pseudonocardia sp.]|jgi:hypothetical protein|nr:hypothetical protein [Pseudonocardia sp.]
MTPDLGTRLDTVITALHQVVIPALPADQVLAREQATLCIGQLTVLAQQYRHVADYEALCLAEMTDLATTLLADVTGGAATTQAAADLRTCLQDGETMPGPVPTTPVHQRRNAIAGRIDELLRAAGRDGTEAFRRLTETSVLEHGARQAARDRAWFQACGMDPDAATLPTIPELLDAR